MLLGGAVSPGESAEQEVHEQTEVWAEKLVLDGLRHRLRLLSRARRLRSGRGVAALLALECCLHGSKKCRGHVHG